MRRLMTVAAVLVAAACEQAPARSSAPLALVTVPARPAAAPPVLATGLTVPVRDAAGTDMDYGGAMALAADDASFWYGCRNNRTFARVSFTGQVLATCAGPSSLPAPLDMLGGLLDLGGGRVILSAFSTYDAAKLSTVSHAVGTLTAPGTWRAVAGARPGQVGGYLAPIPAEWRAALGGDTLTGQGAISIITGSNFGPGVYAFTAADLGVVSPLPARALVAYPAEHRTWGDYGVSTANGYSGSESFGGCFIPQGTSTLSCIWTQATNQHGYCYGNGSSNLAQHLKLVNGEMTCYDPSNSYKGPHGFPYKTYRLDYALADLAAVAAGTKQPWDVTPAARHLLPDSTDVMRVIQGGTFYRPSTGELFVTTYEDRATGRIHRYTIPAASGPVASDCIPGVESLVSDDSATAACVALPDGTGRRTVIEQWTRTGDVPATNGGAACVPVASPRTRSELCMPVPPTPAPTVAYACWVTSVGATYADGDARRVIRCDTNGPVTNLPNGTRFSVTVPR